ncbi:MAG: hypothetical protein KDC45_01070 [Bacteroidetes bacterium]|nr:hypothetical protein [Bacteroidota bacterium]
MRSHFLLLLLIPILPLPLNAQIGTLEKQYAKVSASLRIEERALDSLNQVLHRQVTEIEKEKQRSNPDRTHLEQLMASSVALSNVIKEKQRRLSDLGEEQGSVRNLLDRAYSAEIDLLKKNAGDPGALLLLTEKRLLLVPSLRNLSYDPAKVREIDLTAAADALDRSVKNDYLRKALEEVTGLLETLRTARIETEEVLRLRNKMKDFLEEAGEQSSFNVVGSVRAGTDVSGSPLGGFDHSSAGYAVSMVSILQQLHVTSLPSIRPSIQGYLSGPDYIDLLKKTEASLELYRRQIAKKLE